MILHYQLIIFMALAAGRSSMKCGPLTMHTQTAIHVAEKIMKVCYYGSFLNLSVFYVLALKSGNHLWLFLEWAVCV